VRVARTPELVKWRPNRRWLADPAGLDRVPIPGPEQAKRACGKLRRSGPRFVGGRTHANSPRRAAGPHRPGQAPSLRRARSVVAHRKTLFSRPLMISLGAADACPSDQRARDRDCKASLAAPERYWHVEEVASMFKLTRLFAGKLAGLLVLGIGSLGAGSLGRNATPCGAGPGSSSSRRCSRVPR